MTGIVTMIEAVHRKNSTYTERVDNVTVSYERTRATRLVVWAILNCGSRVWVWTVEGGFDMRSKLLTKHMTEAYFQRLVGKEIEFEGKFVSKTSLPDDCQITYQQLLDAMADWLKEHGSRLEKEVRNEAAKKAMATRTKNRALEARLVELEKIEEENARRARLLRKAIPEHVELKCYKCRNPLPILHSQLCLYRFEIKQDGGITRPQNLILVCKPGRELRTALLCNTCLNTIHRRELPSPKVDSTLCV